MKLFENIVNEVLDEMFAEVGRPKTQMLRNDVSQEERGMGVPPGFFEDSSGRKYVDALPQFGSRMEIRRLNDVKKAFEDFKDQYYKENGLDPEERLPGSCCLAAYEAGVFNCWIPEGDIFIVKGQLKRAGIDMKAANKGNILEYILGLKSNSDHAQDLADSELKAYALSDNNLGLFTLNPYEYRIYFDKKDENGNIVAYDSVGTPLYGNEVPRVMNDILNRGVDVAKHAHEISSQGYRYYEGGTVTSKNYARVIIQKDDKGRRSDSECFEIMTQFYLLKNQDLKNKGEKKKAKRGGDGQSVVSDQKTMRSMEREIVPIERIGTRYEVKKEQYPTFFGYKQKKVDNSFGEKFNLFRTLEEKLQSLIWFPTVTIEFDKNCFADTDWRPYENSDDGKAIKGTCFFAYMEPRKYQTERVSDIMYNFVDCINRGYVSVDFTISDKLVMTSNFKIDKKNPDALRALYRVRTPEDANFAAGESRTIFIPAQSLVAMDRKERDTVANDIVQKHYKSLASPEDRAEARSNADAQIARWRHNYLKSIGGFPERKSTNQDPLTDPNNKPEDEI